MTNMSSYLDRVEAQVCRDGFMTNVMRRHLDGLVRMAPDAENGRRIKKLIARFHRPYAATLRPLAVA
ncbi:MAG TPA: hypothetical protein VEB20_01385 [Azospirillaceae bacterium]|nr:hypothetical protein [Azospirillaceae bacterium]